MRPDPQSGFTLLELLIALAIAAALFAVVVPAWPLSGSKAQVASSARAIADGLRLSRLRAIEANRPAAFVVDTQQATYWLANSHESHSLPSGIRVGIYTTSDAALGSTIGAIRFYPDGSSTGGGVQLDSDRASYEVLVDWLTGGVSIHDHATR